jgi:methyl-accepting chemotaxis protein
MGSTTSENQQVRNSSSIRGLTIFPKILLTILLVTAIPLAGLWYINNYKLAKGVAENVDRSLRKEAEVLSAHVDQWTESNLRVLDQMGNIPDVQSMDGPRQKPILKSITDTYKYIYLAFTVDNTGNNIGRSDEGKLTYYGDRKYAKDVLSGKPIGQQVVIGRSSGKPALILSRPLQGDANQLRGLIAIAVTLEEMSKAVTDARIGETGYAILIDGEGKVVAHGKPEMITEALQDFSFYPAYASPFFNKRITYYVDGGIEKVAYKIKTTLGWTLIVEQNKSDAFSAVSEAKRDALVLFAVTITLMLIIAFWLARRISVPIVNLTRIADKMSRGQLVTNITEKYRADEIGLLAQALERMGTSIQVALKRLSKYRNK